MSFGTGESKPPQRRPPAPPKRITPEKTQETELASQEEQQRPEQLSFEQKKQLVAPLVRTPQPGTPQLRETTAVRKPPQPVVSEPKPSGLARQGPGEKSGPTVAEKDQQIPESLTVQDKVKRLDQANLKFTPQPSSPQRVVLPPPKPKVVVSAALKVSPVLQPVSPELALKQAHANLDLTFLSKTPIAFGAVLKGNENKLTCTLDVGGMTYVLKSGPGYTTMLDHITNTDLFMRLKIAGVRVPLTKQLTPPFRTALVSALDDKDPSQKALLGALGTFDQISEQAPGLTVQDIFTPADPAGLVKTIQGLSNENAALTLIGSLEAALKTGTMDALNGRPLLPKLKDPTTRAQAIISMKAVINIETNKAILSALDGVTQEGVAGFIASTQTDDAMRNTAKAKLTAFIQSQPGAYALGGICFTDLLDGMDDRIVGGKFNPGNFMFDDAKNEFWCVDNSKEKTFALSAKDESQWKTFALRAMTTVLGERPVEGLIDDGLAIDQRLYFLTYQYKTEETREFAQQVQLDAGQEASTQASMQLAVTGTLQKMRAVVNDTTNGLPAPERIKLSARLDFLEARQKFLDLLVFDPVFSDIPSATKPKFIKTLGRQVVALFQDRSPDVGQAEQWKDKAREASTSDQELVNIDQRLTAYLTDPAHTNPDQRFFKALFAARSELFRRALVQKTNGLKALAGAGNKAWGDLTPAAIQSRVKDISDPWRAKLVELADKQGVRDLDSALNDLVSQLTSNPAQ